MTEPTPPLNIGDRVEIDNYHYPPDYGIIRSGPTLQWSAGSQYVFYLVACDEEDGKETEHYVPASRLTFVKKRMAKVYNKRKRLEVKPLDAVYVGRGHGSRWGNPFREGRDGTLMKL